jgi:glutamine synthetase
MPDERSTLQDEAAAFLAAHPETRYLDVIHADLCGVIRGKRYPIAELSKRGRQGLAFPGAVFLLSINGATQDPLGHGFSHGDPDRPSTPGTCRPTSHQETTVRSFPPWPVTRATTCCSNR